MKLSFFALVGLFCSYLSLNAFATSMREPILTIVSRGEQLPIQIFCDSSGAENSVMPPNGLGTDCPFIEVKQGDRSVRIERSVLVFQTQRAMRQLPRHDEKDEFHFYPYHATSRFTPRLFDYPWIVPLRLVLIGAVAVFDTAALPITATNYFRETTRTPGVKESKKLLRMIERALQRQRNQVKVKSDKFNELQEFLFQLRS